MTRSRGSIGPGPGKEGSLGKLGDSWGHQPGVRGGGTASDPEGFRAASAACVQPVSSNLVPEARYLPPLVQHVCLSVKNCRRVPGHEHSLQRRSKHQTRSDVAETWSYHEGRFSNYGQRAKDAGGKSRLCRDRWVMEAERWKPSESKGNAQNRKHCARNEEGLRWACLSRREG